MAYELTEPLFIPFREHGPCQGGRARAGGALSELPRPSVEDNIVSRAHTASHRTHERNETISRLGSPINLRSEPRHIPLPDALATHPPLDPGSTRPRKPSGTQPTWKI